MGGGWTAQDGGGVMREGGKLGGEFFRRQKGRGDKEGGDAGAGDGLRGGDN